MSTNGDELEAAINIIVEEMVVPARELMATARPDGLGNFCPDFRLAAGKTSNEVASH